MADSSISICNRALQLLGTKNTIAALDEDTPQGRQCNVIYEPARKQTLEDFDWPFASTIYTLTPYGTAPDQWTYQYMYPAKAIKIREICFGTRIADPQPFKIGNLDEAGNDRRVIWTDVDDASARVTKDFETVPFMTPKFREAVSAMIAYHICIPLTRDKQLQGNMANYYGAMLAQAEILAGNEGVEDVNQRMATWHEARDAGYNIADLPRVLEPS